VDPELAAVAWKVPTYDLTDVVESRRLDAELTAQATNFPDRPDGAVNVSEMLVHAKKGNHLIPVRIYAPAQSHRRCPGLLLIHGGAFCCGGLESSHARAIYYSGGARCVVVTLGYSLAPEHRFPTGLQDCLTVLRWMDLERAALGIGHQPLAVAGESAGGGLAAAVALVTRDQNGPPLDLQCLLFPVLDHRMATGSMRAHAEAPVWHRRGNEIMWRHYLGNISEVSAYASPAIATNLRGLPRTYIASAEIDPLRDEALEYGIRLLQAGVATEMHNYADAFHAFDLVVPTAVVSRRAIHEQVEVIRTWCQRFDSRGVQRHP
jgi:acetyl esterase/lipase